MLSTGSIVPRPVPPVADEIAPAVVMALDENEKQNNKTKVKLDKINFFIELTLAERR